MVRRRIGYALWLAAMGLLWFFENNTGTAAVLTASVMIPLFSVCCAGFAARRMRVSLETPEQCIAGQSITVICRTEGNSAGVGYRLDIGLSAKNRMTGETLSTEPSATVMAKHGITPWEILIQVDHCGTVECTVTSAVITDWFGLREWQVEGTNRVTVAVLPDLSSVRIHPMLRDEIQNEGTVCIGKIAGSDENPEIREYAPGDPIRMIHWKLTEKMDRVMLRDTREFKETPVLLLLETDRASNVTGMDIHRTVETFLSVATSMAMEGMHFYAAFRDGAGELVRLRIEDVNDSETMAIPVLGTVFTANSESIGGLYFRHYPDENPQRIFVFGTHSSVDAVSFYRGQKITLVLPAGTGMTSGTAETAVLVVDESIPEIG